MCGTKRFLHVSWAQGLSPDITGSSENKLSSVGIPLKRAQGYIPSSVEASDILRGRPPWGLRSVGLSHVTRMQGLPTTHVRRPCRTWRTQVTKSHEQKRETRPEYDAIHKSIRQAYCYLSYVPPPRRVQHKDFFKVGPGLFGLVLWHINIFGYLTPNPFLYK